MTVVLLNCFISLCKANNIDDSFTGNTTQADTTIITVPISIIKEANVKLHERIILKDMVTNLEDKIEVLENVNNFQAKRISSLSDEVIVKEHELKDLKDRNKIYKELVIIETIGLISTIIALMCN